MLPTKGWSTYEGSLRAIGERRPSESDDALFLRELGLAADGELTELGRAYFAARFVHRDEPKANDVLKEAIRNYPPASALCQILAGVADADRGVAETVLRSQGFGDSLTDRSLGALLMMMQRAGSISYSKASGQVRVVGEAAEAPLPRSIFIHPRAPFSNKAWLRKVLQECSGYIYWLDKHFMPVAFEAIVETADANRITSIKVLSLHLPEHDSTGARTSYRDLSTELSNKGIDFLWHVVPSTALRATHDRWIIGATTARNVPNVNAIYSGQHSELNMSDQQKELEGLFLQYWGFSHPLFS